MNFGGLCRSISLPLGSAFISVCILCCQLTTPVDEMRTAGQVVSLMFFELDCIRWNAVLALRSPVIFSLRVAGRDEPCGIVPPFVYTFTNYHFAYVQLLYGDTMSSYRTTRVFMNVLHDAVIYI